MLYSLYIQIGPVWDPSPARRVLRIVRSAAWLHFLRCHSGRPPRPAAGGPGPGPPRWTGLPGCIAWLICCRFCRSRRSGSAAVCCRFPRSVRLRPVFRFGFLRSGSAADLRTLSRFCRPWHGSRFSALPAVVFTCCRFSGRRLLSLRLQACCLAWCTFCAGSRSAGRRGSVLPAVPAMVPPAPARSAAFSRSPVLHVFTFSGRFLPPCSVSALPGIFAPAERLDVLRRVSVRFLRICCTV